LIAIEAFNQDEEEAKAKWRYNTLDVLQKLSTPEERKEFVKELRKQQEHLAKHPEHRPIATSAPGNVPVDAELQVPSENKNLPPSGDISTIFSHYH
jgi:hypothetical protein